MSEKVSRNKTMRQQDFVDVATRLMSWQKGLFPTSVYIFRYYDDNCISKGIGDLGSYSYYCS